MSTRDTNNNNECLSINDLGRPKRQRTLRRDLSDNEPREFRHISRLNSEVSTTTCERQDSLTSLEYNSDILDDINQYFSGLNAPHLHNSIKLPKIRIIRPLAKDDITTPINFRHIAHLDSHEVKRNMDSFDSSSDESECFANSKLRLTKDDISEPTDFRHVAHIGVDNNELRMSTEDTNMMFSFDKSGTSDGLSLEQKDARKSLAELIQSNGTKSKETGTESSRKKLITKDQIGYPENFQHLVHVDFRTAFDPEKYLGKSPDKDVDTKDKEIQNFVSDIIDDNSQSPAVSKPIPKPRSIKKIDIENPKNFRHNAHISCNKDKATAVDNSDIVLRNFFKKVGVTDEHLMEEETRNFIFNFIRQYSKLEGNKSDQQMLVPPRYRNLAEKLQTETADKSHEEYKELLLAVYARSVPI